MIRIALALTLVFSSSLTLAGDAEQQSWPRWRGPAGDARASDTGILKNWSTEPPKLLWMEGDVGRGYASVSVANGHVFTTGNTNGQHVFCLDSADGKEKWRTKITSENPKHGYSGSRTTPSLDGDRLYVVSSAGEILCLKQGDGEIAWRRKFSEWGGRMMSGWGYSESPLVDGDRVLCTPGGKEAMVVCLDKKTGDEIWKCEVPDFTDRGKRGAGYSSIAISNGGGVKQYVQLIGRGVIGVRASDGKFLWGYGKVANTTANIPTPLAWDNYVFASTAYGTGSALLQLKKSSDGGVDVEEKYFLPAKTLQNKHGGMVLVDGHIYCGHGNGSGLPICVEVATGKVKWGGDRRGPGRGEVSVLYVDGHILHRFESGHVALIKADSNAYEVVGSFMPEHQQGKSWSHPVVVGGRLYLREQGKVMCYALK